MVLGHHLIWTAYGWWLPNDPRGSSSHEIRVEKLKDLGAIHYGRKFPQPSAAEIRQFHEQARDRLAKEPLLFNDEDIALIGATIGEVVRREQYVCHACAVMPEHVHMMICRHRDYAETMIEKLQQATRQALITAGRRSVVHPVWGGPGWKVFLDKPERIVGCIEYIEENPEKAGRPRQVWDFVTKYRGSA